MKTYWPMAEMKSQKEPLTTYGAFPTMAECLKQFEIWADTFKEYMTAMWVDVSDCDFASRPKVEKIDVKLEFKAPGVKPEVKDVQRMYDKGIILSSGTVLSKDDVYEISRLLDVKSGMESFEYAAETFRDDGIDFETPDDMGFYKEFQDMKMSYITGSDEIDIAKVLLTRREE